MTLQTLINEISKLAIRQKCVNEALGGTDIYTINGMTMREYPLLFASPTGGHRFNGNTTEYTITLYYLGRLLDDFSNDITLLSTAVEQLKNIIYGIGTIKGVVGVEENYDIVNFTETEAFDDKLAGAYATIRIEAVNETICYEE